MSQTPSTNDAGDAAGTASRPQIPRAKIWIIGGLFLTAAIGMYAGTMYRIQNYGYVGIGDDRPLRTPASQTSTTKSN